MLSDQSNDLKVDRDSLDERRNWRFDFSDNNQSATAANFKLIVDTLDTLFLKTYNRPLSIVEGLILKGVWQRKTYSEMAQESNYSSDYFSNVAAPKLLKQLSKLVKCRITKKNCRPIVTKYIMANVSNNSQNYGFKGDENRVIIDTPRSQKYIKSDCSFFDSCFLEDAISLAQII